jgi:hypothetical protein
MRSTLQYDEALISKSRLEGRSGCLEAAVENIGDQSCVYVSFNGGSDYVLLPWDRSFMARFSIAVRGIHWPPTYINYLGELDDHGLRITYVDPRWEEADVYVDAVFNFEKKEWSVVPAKRTK